MSEEKSSKNRRKQSEQLLTISEEILQWQIINFGIPYELEKKLRMAIEANGGKIYVILR